MSQSLQRQEIHAVETFRWLEDEMCVVKAMNIADAKVLQDQND